MPSRSAVEASPYGFVLQSWGCNADNDATREARRAMAEHFRKPIALRTDTRVITPNRNHKYAYNSDPSASFRDDLFLPARHKIMSVLDGRGAFWVHLCCANARDGRNPSLYQGCISRTQVI
jgi:hypothetical protein